MLVQQLRRAASESIFRTFSELNSNWNACGGISDGTRSGLQVEAEWWALQDSNLQPTDYESAALTIELRARPEATRVPTQDMPSGEQMAHVR